MFTETQLITLRIPFTLLVVFVLFTNTFSQQQPVEVKKSTEKVSIAGKLFYLHQVQQGQTAYSISKAYGVTVKDIADVNPGLIIEQLRAGQIIKIPVIEAASTNIITKLGLEGNDIILHEVKQGENTYFLSKKFNVPLEVIYSLNPGTETGLKVGQVIKIPKRKVLKDVIENVRDYDNYYYYEVKRKDTLYSLSRDYGVTVADIMDNNPELRWGLKSGMVLKIPKVSQYLQDTTLAKQDTLAEELATIQLSKEQCDSIRNSISIRTVNVALMLPFFADFTLELKKAMEDSTYISDDPNVSSSTAKSSFIKGDYYFDFYEGVLLALDTLRAQGLTVNMTVFDTEKDTLRVKKFLKEFEIKKPDLIIGPVFPETFKTAAKYAKETNIPIISPLYSKTSQLKDFPNAYQFIPSRESEFKAIAQLASAYPLINKILIHDSDTTGSEDFLQLKKMLSKTNCDTTDSVYYGLNEIWFSDTLYNNVKHALHPEIKNLVIITSNNEAFVSELLSHLDQNSKNYNISVIGQPSWVTFNNIDLDYFHHLEVNIFTPFHIDYYNSNTKQFLKKAIDIFGYEPVELKSKGYNLAFLGYDIAFYFISAYAAYRNDFNHCMCCMDFNTLLNRYSFVQQNPFYGFENTNMIFLKYNKDFTVSRFYPTPLNISVPGVN